MKPFFAIVVLFAAAAAVNAQTTTSGTDYMDAQIARTMRQQPGNQSFISSSTEKPNEIRRANVTYSGSVVEAVKTGQPLELINPAAPSRFGSMEENTDHDSMTGQASGLKLFAIRF